MHSPLVVSLAAGAHFVSEYWGISNGTCLCLFCFSVDLSADSSLGGVRQEQLVFRSRLEKSAPCCELF